MAKKSSSRLPVQRTLKMYIGGAFPRTESGRTLTLRNADDSLRANYCRGSRKDLRGAVEVARKAQGGWASRAAFNRSQILYRIGEILESRFQLEDRLIAALHSSHRPAAELRKGA